MLVDDLHAVIFFLKRSLMIVYNFNASDISSKCNVTLSLIAILTSKNLYVGQMHKDQLHMGTLEGMGANYMNGRVHSAFFVQASPLNYNTRFFSVVGVWRYQ